MDGKDKAFGKLGINRQIAYGLGDMACNLPFQLTLLYLLFFYTDVFGITPAQAGVIFVIARVLDAVSNPVMGYVMDHTKAKSGNALVYLRFGSLPFALAIIPMFLAPDFGPAGKFAWALGTYILWNSLYTMVNIPYSSLTSQLTDDPQERTSLSSIRMICVIFAIILVSTVTGPMSSAFDDRRAGFLAVAAIYGLIAFALLRLCYRSVRGVARTETRKADGYRLRDLVRVLGGNAPALLVSGIFFLASSATYIIETVVVFYATYNMGKPELVPAFMGCVVLAMILGNLFLPGISKVLDKKGTFYAGAAISGVVCVAFQFMPYDRTIPILICASVSGFGGAMVGTMGWAMLPDTVEYGELKTGIRSEGIIYAFYTFSQKLATAVGGGVVSFALVAWGYVPNAATQTDRALLGIASALGFMPLAFLALAMIAAAFYRLDRAAFEKVKGSLNRGS
jgi:sugar (glycoside-pentoside-hexuronide) transporter